jgi:hypothetical protein
MCYLASAEELGRGEAKRLESGGLRFFEAYMM